MNTDKTHTPENTNNGAGRLNKIAYRDGYLYSKDVEHDIQQQHQEHRPNPHSIPQRDRIAKGLLLGLTLTMLSGFVGGTSFLLAQHYRQSILPVETAPVPAGSQPQSYR
ncbi:MAG TPA: hypothetical protein DCE56_33355 [Cyanobacteria bacterium UBA8553]|nr:hypothetical protein [Cyanobacteria bacterium UBA8553]HAJ59436.1 hypothetical protein [Cyanobacteria bacterium UBA8543]